MEEPMVVVTDPWHLFENNEASEIEPQLVESYPNKEIDSGEEINLQIIEEVKAHRAIWDFADPMYNKKNALYESWAEISDNIGIGVQAAKNRWKSLRGRLRTRMYKAIHSNKKMTLAHFLTTWVYLPSLLFIIEQRINIIVKPNVSEVTSFEDIYLNDYFKDNEETESVEVDVELLEENHSKSNERTLSISESNEIVKEKESSLANYQKEVETNLDPDYLFFTSLLPSMKKLPEVNKQEFLMKIQQMIFEEYMKIDSPNS